MTPDQETALLASHDAIQKQLLSLTSSVAKIPGLEQSLAAKDAEIAELKKGHSTLSQGAEHTAFKTAYPDVPDEVFHNTVPEKRQEVGKALQAQFTKVKAPAKTDLTDPMSVWTNAGGIGPTDDATIAAEQQANAKKIADAKAAGDPLRMLKAKGSAVTEHLLRSLRAPVSR